MTDLQTPDQSANQVQAEAKAKGPTIPNLIAQILSAIITAHLNGLSANSPASLDSNSRKLQSRSVDREKW